MKQTDKVLEYMQKFGSITQMDALKDLGIMRLASRISDLRRQGYAVKGQTETVLNRYGEKCCIKRYSLEAK